MYARIENLFQVKLPHFILIYHWQNDQHRVWLSRVLFLGETFDVLCTAELEWLLAC